MRILELYAGSRSIGKMGEKFGHEVFSVDLKPFEGIDLAISHHRDGQKPKTEFAEKSDRLIKHTLGIIAQCLMENPFLSFYIENPVGMLRKMDFMQGIPRATVHYCQYSDDRMKPTDIWSNNIKSLFQPYGWQPRAKCRNGNTQCHHEPAPRGSDTGTQGKKNNYERSKLPPALCDDVIEAAFQRKTALESEHSQIIQENALREIQRNL